MSVRSERDRARPSTTAGRTLRPLTSAGDGRATKHWGIAAVAGAMVTAIGLVAPGVAGAAAQPPVPAPAAAPRHAPDPAGAARWFLTQRTTPGLRSPKAYARAQQAAVAQAASARAQRHGAAGVVSPIWQALGPAPLIQEPASYTGSPQQNVAGRNDSVATTGTGAAERVAIGAAGGGVWLANPNGLSTTWTTSTDFAASLAFGAVAFAPSNPSVIYGGTGEAGSGGDRLYGQGILVSTDGGANWVARNPGGVLTALGTSALAVDPSDPSHLYTTTTGATPAGFFSSTDSAVSLNQTAGLTSDVSGMVVDPTNFATLYVAVPGVGIEKSVNSGDTFTVMTGGLPPGPTFGNTTLAITPDGTTVYALIEGKAGSASSGALLYKTANAGVSWSRLTAPNVTNPGFYYGGSGTDQGFYDIALAVDPLHPNVVYLGGIGLAMSTNGGATWSSDGCSTATTGCSLGGLGLHPDLHAMTFDAAGNLFIGNDGGLYELASANAATGNAGAAGTNYIVLNTNQSTTQFYPGISQIGNAALLSIGAQDNGTGTYNATDWREYSGGDGAYTVIDPLNTAIQYAQTPDMIEATTDSWASRDNSVKTPAVVSQNFIPPFILAEPAATLDQGILYWGGERPYKSVTGGRKWTVLGNAHAAADAKRNISSLTVAPSNHSIVYSGWGDGTLQVSPDAGTTWSTITPPQVNPATKDAWITHIAVDPADPSHVAVTFSGFDFPQQSPIAQPHVVETSNALAGAPTWVDDTGTGLPNAPANAAVFDGSLLIVGNDVGVYGAVPVGANTAWAPLGSSLPFVPVMDLSLSSDKTTLVAATHGRGAWKLALPTAANQFIISELRFSGPGGSGDDYVDLYNTAPTPASLGGWSVAYGSGDVVNNIALPAVSVPPGGHYLVAGSQFSLAGAAAPDLAPTGLDIPSGGGVSLLAPGGAVSDAVGFTTAPVTLREGAGLPAVATPGSEHAFLRNLSAGRPTDTNDNAADFTLVAVDGPTASAGAALGAPDPENLASPVQTNRGLSSSLLDPAVAAGAAPNRAYDATSRTLTIRRTITNNTGRTIQRLDLHVSSISVAGLPGTHATLRLQTSASASVATSTGPVEVLGVTLKQPPTQANGGGLDSVVTVPLPTGGLTGGQSLSVSFRLSVDQGGSFWFGYDALAR